MVDGLAFVNKKTGPGERIIAVDVLKLVPPPRSNKTKQAVLLALPSMILIVVILIAGIFGLMVLENNQK